MPPKSPPPAPAEPAKTPSTPQATGRPAKVAPRVGKKAAPKPRRIGLFASPAERWALMRRMAADLEFEPEMKADA